MYGLCSAKPLSYRSRNGTGVSVACGVNGGEIVMLPLVLFRFEVVLEGVIAVLSPVTELCKRELRLKRLTSGELVAGGCCDLDCWYSFVRCPEI